MGCQIHFHMLPEDEEEFLRFVRNAGNVDILPWKSPVEKFSSFRELPKSFSGDLWGSVYLFNRSIPNRFIVTYIPTQKYYTIEGSGSSVVEFSRSFLKGNELKQGRLWADFVRFTDESLEKLREAELRYGSPLPAHVIQSCSRLEPKEPEFKVWYETLARWIRKNLKPTSDPNAAGEHVGPAATKAVKEGRITLGSSA